MGKSRGKFLVLAVFALFAAAAMMFVSWLIYAVFEENYKDIKRQYYAVVSGQTTQSIENSVKNGKTIESFYGMDRVLGEMLELISTDEIPISTAITDTKGGILYRSYCSEDKRGEFDALIGGELKSEMTFSEESGAYKAVTVGGYDLDIQRLHRRQDGVDAALVRGLLRRGAYYDFRTAEAAGYSFREAVKPP